MFRKDPTLTQIPYVSSSFFRKKGMTTWWTRCKLEVSWHWNLGSFKLWRSVCHMIWGVGCLQQLKTQIRENKTSGWENTIPGTENPEPTTMGLQNLQKVNKNWFQKVGRQDLPYFPMVLGCFGEQKWLPQTTKLIVLAANGWQRITKLRVS